MSSFVISTSSSANTNTRVFNIPLSSGTVAVTTSSTTVTGTSTNFLRWLKVGDTIIVNNETKKISSITSDTVLITDTAFTANASGQSLVYIPSEVQKTGNRVVVVKAFTANTAIVRIGESRNVNSAGATIGDGSDITDTNRNFEVSAGQLVAPLVVNNLYNLYVRSSGTSQLLSISVN